MESDDETLRQPLQSSAEESLSVQVFNKDRRNDRVPRVVLKSGEFGVAFPTQFREGCLFSLNHLLVNVFETLIDAKWRYVIGLFCGTLVGSWIFFAFIWWAVVIAHEDDIHGTDDNTPTSTGNGSIMTPWRPCVSNVYDFNGALLFSVDLQTTNGFGYSEIETTCPGAIVLFMFQCALGGFIEVVTVAVLFAKLVRPKRRTQTVLFSRNAVARRFSTLVEGDTNEDNDSDGCFTVQFRIADIRLKTARLTSAVVSAYVILFEQPESADGRARQFLRRTLTLTKHTKRDGDDSEQHSSVGLLLLWPETLTHRVDATSPLYDVFMGIGKDNKRDSFTQDCYHGAPYEIVVVLEGTDSATGRQLQARTSYTPEEIIWNRRLKPLTAKTTSSGQRIIDFTNFHDTIEDVSGT